MFRNKYSKAGGYRKKESEKHHLKERVQMICATEVIKARNKQEAERKFIYNVDKKFNSKEDSGLDSFEHYYYNLGSDNIDFIDTYEESSEHHTTPSTMFLRAGSPIEYNFTTREKKF